MQIGLIADSHDRPDTLKAAVEYLNETGVELVLHAGDFVAPFALAGLERLHADWRGVFGNNDGERMGLEKVSKGRIAGPWLRFEFAGRTIGVIHDEKTLGAAMVQGLDLLVCGHTHQAKVEQRDGVVMVNPGELCGYLSGRSSLAVVDLDAMQVESVVLG